MADTLGAEKMDDRLRGIFAAGLGAWEAAAGKTGVVERSYIIAGYPVRLRFAGPALVGAITRALAHLEAHAETEPMLTIHLGDSRSTGMDVSAHLGLQPESQDGAGWIHRGERFRARFQPVCNRLNILDCRRDVALFWIDAGARVPFWERSAPLLYIFHWWMALHGRQLVHAAALGTAAGGALLVGRAGSGKSTTALACLRSELAYAGDDYHLIALEPSPFAFSLYNSAKVHAAQLEWFDDLRLSVANPDELAEEKAVIFMRECRPEKISPGFPIRAVLAPRIAQRRDTRVEPASPATALAAMAPSTVLQLRDRGTAALNTMADLLRQVPSFTLELGTDLSQIAPAILQLLSHAGVNPRSRPLVSVVVPVYNGERFLRESLESVFAQDYRPIEVIVVDDGSSDGTARVARSFDGIRYFFQKNSGQAAARNAGIRETRGEYIAFLDADDLMLPNKLSAQVDYLLQHPETGCVLAGQETLFEAGVDPPSWIQDRAMGERAGISFLSPSSAAELALLRAGGMSSVMVRRRVPERVGGFDPRYRYIDDLDWLFRIWKSGLGVGVLPQILWRRRVHGANLTYRRDHIEKEWLAFFKSRIDRHRSSRAAVRREPS